MTLKDWGPNLSRGSFLPSFLWPFCFVLHFFYHIFLTIGWLQFIHIAAPSQLCEVLQETHYLLSMCVTCLNSVCIIFLSVWWWSNHHFLLDIGPCSVKQVSGYHAHEQNFVVFLSSTLLLTKVSRSLYPQSKFFHMLQHMF